MGLDLNRPSSPGLLRRIKKRDCSSGETTAARAESGGTGKKSDPTPHLTTRQQRSAEIRCFGKHQHFQVFV
ncbi:hypothetical protein MHYP_G00350750 [Metynnis hypsauchen]